MNNISFCANPIKYFHEDSLVSDEILNKGKKVAEKFVEKIEHTPFDGLIEKTAENRITNIQIRLF